MTHSTDAGAERFIAVTVTSEGITVAGDAAARIDHPWPRDPSCSDVFAEWEWDGKTLTASNDQWGFQPLFYAASNDRIAVSPSIPVLLRLRVPTQLDDDAMAVFLRLSHFVGTDTPFKAVKTLPRAGRLTWTPGAGASVSSVPWAQSADHGSRQSAVDGYVDLFRQAVERRLPRGSERLAVPLSGGHDSRHILFELARFECRPVAAATIHHYPPASDDDAVVATRVAAAAGVRHQVIPRDVRRVAVERRKNVMTSFCADRHAQMMPLVDFLRGRADLIFDGLCGDIFSGSRLENLRRELALYENGRCDELADLLLHSHSSEEALQAVLQPAARQRFALDGARTRVADELRRHVHAPHPWGSYRLQNRTARSVALLPFAMVARSSRVMTPYLDRDLVGFLAALPTSALADGQLHTEVIARAFPQHAHLRYEHRNARSEPAPRYFRRLAWELAREALRLGTSPLVRRPFVISRLLKPALSGTPPWIQERRLVYLMQLEELTTTGWSGA